MYCKITEEMIEAENAEMNKTKKENLFKLMSDTVNAREVLQEEEQKCKELIRKHQKRVDEIRESLKRNESYSLGVRQSIEILGLTDEYLRWRDRQK